MTVLVTGAAGFIGMHVSAALLARGELVIGVDDLNPYYDVALKAARLQQLEKQEKFTFHQMDIAEPGFREIWQANPGIDRAVHLAAQAGVRYSLTHPEAYTRTNVAGHLSVLEACRHHDGFRHLVYASSSSVYGDNRKMPFSVTDRVDRPISLYAATKRSAELMSQTYAHLYRLPQTGLRFFTVYGPWGRPDMSAFLFARAIFDGQPIQVFNHGQMKRDFTYIDDIVSGVLNALDRPPPDEPAPSHRLYNLGNHRSEKLMDFIAAIEQAIGREAEKIMAPMQPGDVPETFADIASSQRELDFQPRTTIAEGIPKFIAWFREYHGL